MSNQAIDQPAEGTPQTPAAKKALVPRDDLVLVPLILLLLLTVVVNYVRAWHLPPLIVSVLLATAISALVFRFLGGIGPDTAFTMGALKFGGSLAALVGSAWLFNSYLPTQTRGVNELFDPHFKEWIPLDRQSGAPVASLSIAGIDTPLKFPQQSPFRRLPLSLQAGGIVAPEGRPEFSFGILDESDLKALKDAHSLRSEPDHFVVTERLEAKSGRYDLDPLPYSIETGEYGGDFSRLTIYDRQGEEKWSGGIQGKGTRIITTDEGFLFVAVVQVKHNAKEKEKNYAMFAVAEVGLDSRLGFP